MPTRSVMICNDLGLHARAAARLVECAGRFASEVKVSHGDRTVNAKSIMGVLMLAAAKGTMIEIETRGEDETAAMNGVCALVEDGFGEL